MGGWPARSAGGPPLLALIRTIPHKVTPCYRPITSRQMDSIDQVLRAGFPLSILSVKLTPPDVARICGHLPLRSATRIRGVGTCINVWCAPLATMPSATRLPSRTGLAASVLLRITPAVTAYTIIGSSEGVSHSIACASALLLPDSAMSLLLVTTNADFERLTRGLRAMLPNTLRKGRDSWAFELGLI